MGAHFWLSLLMGISLSFGFRSSRIAVSSRVIGRMRIYLGEGEKDWWADDEGSDEIVHLSDENKACMQGGDLNLFDQLPNRPNWFGALSDDRSTIAMQTLREISESYLFSLSFLGDYVVQLGVRPPIDVDAKVGDFLTSEQAYSLLEALTSLDPYESNIEYDSMTATEVANELGLSTEDFCFICDGERLNLPYGMDTVLHQSVVEKIREVVEYDDYRHLDHQRQDEAE